MIVVVALVVVLAALLVALMYLRYRIERIMRMFDAKGDD